MGIEATSAATIRWPQQQTVLPGGHYHVFRDNRDGIVVYADSGRIGPAPIDAWPDGEGKVGDGMGPDGYGPDGYGHGGIGDGLGADGLGMDGIGAAMMSLASLPLADGLWTFAVVAYDPAGNPAAPSIATRATAMLAGTPKPPASLTATNWDNETGTLTLTIGLSADDEGP